jgi:hypothetical protein
MGKAVNDRELEYLPLLGTESVERFCGLIRLD